MPLTCKTRPVEIWDNLIHPYSIEHFTADKGPYHIAAGPNIEMPSPHPDIHDESHYLVPLRNCLANVTTFANDHTLERAIWEQPFAPDASKVAHLKRVGLEAGSAEVVWLLTKMEKNPPVWKEAANYYQDLFERESWRKGIDAQLPRLFKVQILHYSRPWHDGDE